MVIIILIIVLATIFGILFARAIVFTNKFKKISVGMTYHEVVSIVDRPYKEIKTDNINTCLWRIAVLRGWHLTRIVVFKDSVVVSKHDDSYFA